jgi:hypothetical protein
MLRTSILLAIHALYENEQFYFQQDGAPPHYHRDVRTYLYETMPGQWIGRRGAVEYPPRSPDIAPLDFYVWGTLKDIVYRRKPATLAALREEIEMSCPAITVDTLVTVARSVVRQTQMCLDANGEHFEHFK